MLQIRWVCYLDKGVPKQFLIVSRTEVASAEERMERNAMGTVAVAASRSNVRQYLQIDRGADWACAACDTAHWLYPCERASPLRANSLRSPWTDHEVPLSLSLRGSAGYIYAFDPTQFSDSRSATRREQGSEVAARLGMDIKQGIR